MSYSTNYTNRATIFDTGDTNTGDQVKSIYDELGAAPGSVITEMGVPYRAGWWWNAARDMGAGPAQMSPGILEMWPMVLDQTIQFDRIGTYVTTAGDPGTVIRMGIYNSNSDGMPSTLIAASAATQDATVLNTSTFAGEAINVTLDRGRYYVAAAGFRPNGTAVMPFNYRGASPHYLIPSSFPTIFTVVLTNAASTLSLQLSTNTTPPLPADLSASNLTLRSSGSSMALRMV